MGKFKIPTFLMGGKIPTFLMGGKIPTFLMGGKIPTFFYGWENLEIYCVTPVHAVSAAALKFDLCD